MLGGIKEVMVLMSSLTIEVLPILQPVTIGLKEETPIHIQAGEELKTRIEIGVVEELLVDNIEYSKVFIMSFALVTAPTE